VVKPRWERLIADRDGFFLEDKGWALAIHARFAADGEAEGRPFPSTCSGCWEGTSSWRSGRRWRTRGGPSPI
jgi:hypothetical protein